MKPNIIAVDFDGTLCENKWPEIGMPNEELIEYLKKRQANGEKLILWTNRVGNRLDEAVKWSAEKGLVMSLIFLQDHRTGIVVLLGSTPGATGAFSIVNVQFGLTNPVCAK